MKSSLIVVLELTVGDDLNDGLIDKVKVTQSTQRGPKILNYTLNKESFLVV